MDRKETKKDNPFYIAFICILLLGPFIAGPILFVMGKNLAGILAFVIPYLCLALIGVWRKYKLKRDFYKIKDAHTRFDIIPVTDAETLAVLREHSALTFFGEPAEHNLNHLYNWLNNEGVLKEERVKLYTYSGADLKNAFGKRMKIGSEEKFMSIDLTDLNLNDSNTRQFSLDRMQIGGRWLDDIIWNSK
ncbi:MAG: hypothetical protein J5696_01795 [Lachnospiraceae bacterium]|nr:hypothetical protein [Lachnospiraceae bacterium]MBR5677500.1 hypothetical protein [Paludibacteraceae bacterium]